MFGKRGPRYSRSPAGRGTVQKSTSNTTRGAWPGYTSYNADRSPNEVNSVFRDPPLNADDSPSDRLSHSRNYGRNYHTKETPNNDTRLPKQVRRHCPTDGLWRTENVPLTTTDDKNITDFREGAPSNAGNSRRSNNPGGTRATHHRNATKHGKFKKELGFFDLLQLANEETKPFDVVCYFDREGIGLTELLERNEGNDHLELVLVILGQFCQKGGATTFQESFIQMIKILGSRNIFKKVTGVLVQLPYSSAKNLPPLHKRISRLLTSLCSLTEYMITISPASACNMLGKDFFKDILSIKSVLHIQHEQVDSAFELINKGVSLLENTWNLHERDTGTSADTTERLNNISLDEEEAGELPNNFRTLNVLPAYEDICTNNKPYLRKNIIRGSYPDVDTYLDTQFRLLQEDFYYPLRKGIVAYKNNLASGKSHGKIENVRLYFDVKIVEVDVIRNRYVLTFSMRNLQRIQWESSKRFLNGSLLCLSDDDFTSIILFTVKERDVRLLYKGQIVVGCEGGASLLKNKNRAYVMAESSVYFEAYRGVLEALQRISPSDFPLPDYILCRCITPTLPDYLIDEQPVYDLTPLTDKLGPESCNKYEDESRGWFRELVMRSPISQITILNAQSRPPAEELGLDSAQSEALFAALTQKVVVIQGPPGTGKTYLGLRIIQTLLHNKKHWWSSANAAPILIVCYTNHALDQFLEGIMKVTAKIVRLGGQSKSEAMKMFALYEWRRKLRLSRWQKSNQYHSMMDLRREMNSISLELRSIEGIIQDVAGGGIVHERTLREFNIIPEELAEKFQQLKATSECDRMFRVDGSVLPFWLGVHSEEEVTAVMEYFQRSSENLKMIETRALDTQPDEGDEDDQWDKEDVEEAQRQRATEVDEIITEELKQEALKGDITDLKIKFGFLFKSFDHAIQAIKDELESREDINPVEKLKYERTIVSFKKYAEKISTLMEAVPVVERKLDDHNLNIPLRDRWLMYTAWKNRLSTILEEKQRELLVVFENKRSRFKNFESMENAEICKNAFVVGITTSGAAKQQALLNHLQPKIVVVEEAAEVLEAHITVSLSKNCQHLILIGDHKQLRPPTTVYHLAKDYHLDISLFERLINNGMKHYTLGVQHRMRPEIARLITPAIYPELQNHHSVLGYPRVKGMKQNVFFFYPTNVMKQQNTKDVATPTLMKQKWP